MHQQVDIGEVLQFKVGVRGIFTISKREIISTKILNKRE